MFSKLEDSINKMGPHFARNVIFLFNYVIFFPGTKILWAIRLQEKFGGSLGVRPNESLYFDIPDPVY